MSLSDPGKESIIVVDDLPENLKALTAILSNPGYQVRPALSGELALNTARKKPPDLILLDIRMPGMDGYEVCRRLKQDENTRNIPVIFISGLDEVRDKVKAFDVGGQDYITKPFQPEEVLARVGTHLSLCRMQQQIEIKALELEKANIKLQELERLKSMFIASMSHELRTPLNSIIGFTSWLLMGMEGGLNAEQSKQLSMVKSSADHLLNLINDILDISKIEADKIDLDIKEFELSEITKDAVKTVLPLAMDKGIELSAHVPEEIKLANDRRRLKQVLVNLVNNAVKFTDRGKVEILAKISSGKYLVVTILDTGIGIREEEMGKLFQPFQQIDMSSTKPYEGTGLGLYLCRKILDLLHGKISVESTYGKGSTFMFSLPLNIEDWKSGAQK